MFSSPFCTLSWHISLGQGLMGTQCLPDSPRELLREWYSSSIHSLSSQIHPTILPGTKGNKGPLQTTCLHSLCYFGFHWPLVGQLCFYHLSWLHSPRDVSFIFWILKCSKEEFVSLSSICLKCSDSAVTITKQKKPIGEERVFWMGRTFALWL